MPASRWPSVRFLSACILCGIILAALAATPARAQDADRIRPVTDAELLDPSPDEWLMWRRTLNGWGYSPLDQVNRDTVGSLRLVWSRALATDGRQQGTPLVRNGVMFMPNPQDTIQAIDAVTGDLIWEYRRDPAGRPGRLHDRQPDRHQPQHRHPRRADLPHQRWTTTSSPSTRRRARWCGTPRSSTTR